MRRQAIVQEQKRAAAVVKRKQLKGFELPTELEEDNAPGYRPCTRPYLDPESNPNPAQVRGQARGATLLMGLAFDHEKINY